MTPTRVLVLDGNQRPALAVTRSLGRRGATVVVGEEHPICLASTSRYCAGSVTYPSPYHQPDAFNRFLLEILDREAIDVLLPVTDVTTHAVARNQDAIRRRSAVAVPPIAAFELVSNKGALLERAEACGIPVPRTHVVCGAAGLDAVLGQIDFPAVVKPARSRIRTATGWLKATVHYASSAADLVRLFRSVDYLAGHPSLIQERIQGPGVGVFVLCDRGQLVAAFAHQRLREKPPSGGASVLCESVALDPDLCEQAMRLLQPLGWHGVAMLEYKRDQRTGQAFLMEVNGRFWGSLQLAVDAGVDFPYLACQLARGERPGAAPVYEVGVQSRWLLGDLDHLLMRLFHRDREVPDSAPSTLRTLVEFLRFTAPGLRYDVVRRDDLRPTFHELREYQKAVVASAAARMKGHATRLGSPAARLGSTLAAQTQDGGRDAGAFQ